MRKLVTLTLCAALPLAGFALSDAASNKAWAQDDTSYATMPVAPVYGSAPPQPTYMGTQVSSAAAEMTRMSQLEQQVRDLTNQVEQRDFQLRQLQEAFDRYVADTNMRIQDIESRGGVAARPAQTESFDTPASDAPSYTPSAPASSSSMPPQPSAQQGSTAVPGTLPDPDAPYQPSVTPPLGQMNQNSGITPNADGTITSGRGQSSGGNAAQAYDQAFGFLQQSNYTDAENAFRNFLATYPTHPLAANAQYWLGETYFAQTQYSTAAKTFAKAFQDYPKGQKAPDALLKLSLTLEKMNKKSDACLTLKELKKRFPTGPASVLRRGDEEAIRMSCPA